MIARADGSLIGRDEGAERQTGMAWWPAQTLILAALCLYEGKEALGLEMAYKNLRTLIVKLEGFSKRPGTKTLSL